MAIKGRRATYEERVTACEALEAGITADEIAKVLRVSRSSVFEWQKTYRAHGAEALRTKKTRGPESKLSGSQMSQLYRLIAGIDPRQYSVGPALWTRGLVQELVLRQFGIRLSLASIGNVLRKLGMSPPRPLHRAYERDPEKFAGWKTGIFPKIQAQAKKDGAAIFFADEASVLTNHHVRTTRAAVGEAPVVAAPERTRSISMLSAISPRGELHFRVYESRITKAEFLGFCKMLLADVGRPVFLIVDNSQVHHAKIITEYAAQSKGMLTLFFFPPYAPELIPDEWVWENVKHDDLGGPSAKNGTPLTELASGALSRLKAAPEKLLVTLSDPSDESRNLFFQWDRRVAPA